MFNLFGTKKSEAPAAPAPVPTHNTVIRSKQNLQKSLETFEKRQAHLEKQMEILRNNIKAKLRKKDKAGAKQLIARLKGLEKQNTQMGAYMNKLMFLQGAVEGSIIKKEMVEGMQHGISGLRAAQAGMDEDEVDNIMGDLQEEMEKGDRIGDALGASLPGELDDFELDEALGEMEAEMAQEEMLAPPAVAAPPVGAVGAGVAAPAPAVAVAAPAPAPALDLPAAPSHVPMPAAEDDMDAALAALEADMAT